MDVSQYNTTHSPTWCPGCGDFGIWGSIKNALAKQELGPSDAVFVYDIGCNSNMSNALKVQGFESLHGRPIPLAEGIRLANHNTPVVVIGGDGGTFGEGSNHLIHAARRNINITVLVHDNHIYGLTTGQTSPTTKKGTKTKSSPDGANEYEYNPIAVALAAEAGFIARGFAGDIPYLTDLIVKGMQYKGFSFIDILQPCVTFNHFNTYQWYREHIYKLEESGYKADNRLKAYEKAYEPFSGEGKIGIGIYLQEDKPCFEDLTPQLKNMALRDMEIGKADLNPLFEEFK